MNKRKIALLILMFLLLLVILLLCVKYSNNSEKNNLEENKDNSHIESVLPVQENTVPYISTNGYTLKYNPDAFLVKYENGVESFIHKTEDLYLKIYVVEEVEVEKKKEQMNEASIKQGECSFADGNLVGYYTIENLLDETDKNKVKRNFMFDLANKNMLVIETKMFASTEKDRLENNQINMMIDTIKFQ